MRKPGRRLRIAYVYRYFNTAGSIPSVYVERAERLAEVDDVTAVCSAATRQSTSAPLRFETVEPLVRGDGRLSYALECGSFALRATRFLRRNRSMFDLVHVVGFAAAEADLVTVHGVRPAEMDQYFTHVEPSVRLRRRLTPLIRPQTGTVLAIERRLFRPPFPLCLPISAGIGADLQRHYGVPSDLIEVIPWGVDCDRFRPDAQTRERVRLRYDVDPERLVLLFVGDAFERKGLDRAVAALAAARAEAELWVAGGGASDRYRAAAARLGVSDRVKFLGRISNEELASVYPAADVLVLPTRQDSWGHTVLEAMASGCVVVVSERAGSHEIVRSGESGFVLEGSGEPAEMAALIEGPLSNPDERSRLGRSALAVARSFDRAALHARFRAVHHRAFERRLELESRTVQ